MNKLDINRINEYASYKVELEENDYIFETDYNIQYGVSFDPEENYIAIIVKRTHPQLPTIIDVFDKQIAMFRANKPE